MSGPGGSGGEGDGPDLVVVGGGVAGLCAARRLQQLGGTAVILERSPTCPGMGNGRLSGGWFHAAHHDPRRHEPEELYDAVMAATEGQSRPDLARAWSQNVRRALEFLGAEGGVFAAVGPEEDRANVLQPPRPVGLGQQWEDMGPDRLLRSLAGRFLDAGGTFLTGHRARRLVCEDGRVVGVEAETAGGTVRVSGGAVLLADGGFQANADLVAAHITSGYKLRGSPNDTGDALEMGRSLGAATTQLGWFYGYPLLFDSLADDRLWPGFGPLELIAAGLLVDGSARRFTDEGAEGEPLADAIAKSATPLRCAVVFDDAIWQGAGRSGDLPLNPNLIEVGGTLWSGPTPEALAALAGLAPAALAASVAAHNAACAGGAPARPPRSGRPRPLTTPPFHAVPVVAGITFTMGGLVVDGHGRVQHDSGAPIDGLYAAGGSMGGLQGGAPTGYAGGWSEASTFGLLVAEHVAGVGADAGRG